MALTDAVSIPTQGAGLYLDGNYVGGVSNITGFGSGSVNKISIANLGSDRQITRKGLIDEGSVSIDGIDVPHGDVAAQLEVALHGDTINNFQIMAGGALGLDGTSSGKARVQASGIAFSAIADSSSGDDSEYDLTLGSAGLQPPVAVGDYVRIGAASYKVSAVAVKADGSGSITIISATDISAISEREFDLIRPAIVYSFTGTIDSLTRDLSTNEVIRYSMTIGSIASIETAIVSATA